MWKKEKLMFLFFMGNFVNYCLLGAKLTEPTFFVIIDFFWPSLSCDNILESLIKPNENN